MVFKLDPLADCRWAELVDRHPDATVFHTTAWLDALRRTYKYEPVVFTTSRPEVPLNDGIVFCHIRSWLTGNRLVSLPFSDHCDPLAGDTRTIEEICRCVVASSEQSGWRRIELRPRRTLGLDPCVFSGCQRYWLHEIDLRRPLHEVFESFSKDSIQRKIGRAKQAVTYVDGANEELLVEFYRLVSMTRRRHHLPPQPLAWFRNPITCFGAAMTIRLARYEGRAIAGILTLRHRWTTVYKYGGSDADFHQLGGMQLVFWKMIQDAHAGGCAAVDLGRSDEDHHGLVTFKDRWGASRSTITYVRTPPPEEPSTSALRAYVMGNARRALGRAPEPLRTAAGKFLYRHVG